MKTLRDISDRTGYAKTTLENWVKRVKADNPGIEFGHSDGAGKAKTYNDDEIQMILAYAPKSRQVKPLYNQSSAMTTVSTGIVPSHVGLATDAQLSSLDSAIQRFTPATTELNGQQQTNLDGLNLLISAVDQATAINDQKQSELENREQTVAKSEQVLELVKDKLLAEQKRNKALNYKASDIAEREQAVNELLGKLGVS